MSDELLLVAVVAAALVAIYLLRNVIVLALRLIVLAGLVLAGYWAWQHRAELIEAAPSWLGGLGDRLRALDLPVLSSLPELQGPSDGPDPPEDAGGPEITGVPEGPD